MNSQLKQFLTGLAPVLAIVCAVMLAILVQRSAPRAPQAPQVGALNTESQAYNGNSTYLTYSVTSTAQKVLAQNSTRKSAQCVNNGPSSVYCWDNNTGTGLTATSGQIVAANGGVNFDSLDPSTGELWCITSGSATSSIVCRDK
jgi:hypothetical protein